MHLKRTIETMKFISQNLPTFSQGSLNTYIKINEEFTFVDHCLLIG